MGATNRDCAWPYGCGDDADPGFPYCTFHRNVRGAQPAQGLDGARDLSAWQAVSSYGIEHRWYGFEDFVLRIYDDNSWRIEHKKLRAATGAARSEEAALKNMLKAVELILELRKLENPEVQKIVLPLSAIRERFHIAAPDHAKFELDGDDLVLTWEE